MKTIRGALGVDPGRTMRNPGARSPMPQGQAQAFLGAAPAKGSGQLGQYHRQQQQISSRPTMEPQRPMTGGPMYAPQGAGAVPQMGGGFMLPPGQAPQMGGGFMLPQQGVGIGNFMQNQVGAINPQMQQQMVQGVGQGLRLNDMTAQQRNPNYIQGR